MVVSFYFIKRKKERKKFSCTRSSFKHNGKTTKGSIQRSSRARLGSAEETKQGDVLSFWLPPSTLSGGQSSCISDADGRWGGGGSGNAQEAGVQVLRIPDTTPTTGSGNTEPTTGLSVPAWRAQVGPQLHWAFLSVVINGPCIESMRGSNWHVERKETLWKGSEPRAVGASPWLCSLSRLMPAHKIDI